MITIRIMIIVIIPELNLIVVVFKERTIFV